jgi:GDP-4-dehydro-6-deoxy-D-mannose reductase
MGDDFLRILITGARGFAGRHLVHHLRECQPDAEIHGTTLEPEFDLDITLHHIDLRNPSAVHDMIGQVRPDHIYHLAAQADVKASFADPWGTLETNIRSELNLFEGCVAHNLRPRILIVSTGELYANATVSDHPADESTPPRPTSPYSVSKLSQELLGLQYHLSRQFPVIIVRPFNQFGPGQREGFVAPDFAMQIARIERGYQPPVIKVGNLETRRDFSDVRDVARAKRLLMAAGKPGEYYNVASGVTHRIGDILEQLLAESKVPITVEQDAARMRPANVPITWGNASKLRELTGWKPEIPFAQSLRDILNDCRARIQSVHPGETK